MFSFEMSNFILYSSSKQPTLESHIRKGTWFIGYSLQYSCIHVFTCRIATLFRTFFSKKRFIKNSECDYIQVLNSQKILRLKHLTLISVFFCQCEYSCCLQNPLKDYGYIYFVCFEGKNNFKLKDSIGVKKNNTCRFEQRKL